MTAPMLEVSPGWQEVEAAVSSSGAGRPAEAPVRPRMSVTQLLAADTFESDQDLEEFLAFTYAERHRDLA